jgi:hypothetical protein
MDDTVLRLSDQIFVIIMLSSWFLFPIGVFISVSQLDKNTVHEIDLNVVRKETDAEGEETTKLTLNPTAESARPRPTGESESRGLMH